MKKLLIAILALACRTAHAYQGGTINIASFTQTNDTTACIISSAPMNDFPHFLNKVIVGAASGTGSGIIIYGSTWTTTPIISSISLNTVTSVNFDDTKVHGLCYTTYGNTAGVTIIYKR